MIEVHDALENPFHTTGDFLGCECGAIIPKLPPNEPYTCPVCGVKLLNEDAADADVEEIVLRFNHHNDLLSALRATVKPLLRLGDFIGNEDAGGPSGLGPFDRCEIVLQVRKALAPFETGSNPSLLPSSQSPSAMRDELWEQLAYLEGLEEDRCGGEEEWEPGGTGRIRLDSLRRLLGEDVPA
jgi:hypothetical protein